MNEKELRELVERYQKEHFEKWTEWASKPDAEIGDLDVYNKYNLDQLYNQCHFCEISSKSKSSIKSKYAKYEYPRCELCLENISTFPVNCFQNNSLWKCFYYRKDAPEEKSIAAIKIAYSMRPTDEIVENLKPYLCKQEKWEPRVSPESEFFTINGNGRIDRSLVFHSDYEPAANNLAICPCGKTPSALNITDNGQGLKWATVTGDCCGEWGIEFRTGYNPFNSKECMDIAIEAWNNAPRALLSQQEHIIFKGTNYYEPNEKNMKKGE